jgi:hypothetical protein
MLSGVQLEKAMTPNLTNLTDKKNPALSGFFLPITNLTLIFHHLQSRV